MNTKDLFDLYAGQEIRFVQELGDSCWKVGEYVKLVGYRANDNVLMIRKDHYSNLHSYQSYIKMPDLPGDACVWAANPLCFDWSDIKGQPGVTTNICCRCGKPYKNKKKHKAECK